MFLSKISGNDGLNVKNKFYQTLYSIKVITFCCDIFSFSIFNTVLHQNCKKKYQKEHFRFIIICVKYWPIFSNCLILINSNSDINESKLLE